MYNLLLLPFIVLFYYCECSNFAIPGVNLNLPKVQLYQTCTGEGTRVDGLCKTSIQCNLENGIIDGSCASGLFSCCLPVAKCGSIVNDNNTYFVNEDFPNYSNKNQICKITINKIITVQQILLQFVRFDLQNPINGECTADAFRATGANSNSYSPKLCGQNNGQHLYYSVDQSSSLFELTIGTSGIIDDKDSTSLSTYGRLWMIKIIQLEANNPLIAPEGCLQYYNGTTNQIKSFNFDSSKTSSQSLIKMNYAICIRREDGYCSVNFASKSFDLGCFNNENVISKRATHYGTPVQQGYHHQDKYSPNDMPYKAHYGYESPQYPTHIHLPDEVLDEIVKKLRQYMEKTESSVTTEAPQVIPEVPLSQSCTGKNELIFPPSEEDGQHTVMRGNIFNDGKVLKVATAAPYVVYADIEHANGIGFDIFYEQMICTAKSNEL